MVYEYKIKKVAEDASYCGGVFDQGEILEIMHDLANYERELL